jgi:hypothetical protein
MKKFGFLTLCAVCAFLLASCGKDYTSFVGTWGVEKIEYFNTDYAGNPIPATIVSYTYDPNDIGNGIQLVFKSDKTGEMRDNDVDTVWYNWNSETEVYDSYVVNPDTTLVTQFSYSYDDSESTLYMNMAYTHTFRMKVSDLTSNSFTYMNEYSTNYVERAYLKRLSNDTSKSTNRNKPAARPRKIGSFLSGK